ncbi:transcription factor ACEII [Fusarium circinatum]|uniref:Transcription factor ACEII n=1 Tax=Fusarium circinatum TaxID=48490 RepID=A0A8H5UKZ6_FUSCI|nr:transcription factor ACEII [Fusarium circinatum]
MSELRQACDRCHSKKLKCTKIPASSVCTRCVKAGVTCLFSPPTRSLRHPDNVVFNWSMLGLDEPATDPVPGIDLEQFITTPPVSEDADPLPPPPPPPLVQVTEISQLTDLMVGLDRLQTGFPTSQRDHLSARELTEFIKICKFDLGSFLEELLQRSQKLLHLYPEVLKRLEPEDISCDAPDCIHNAQKELPLSKSRVPIDQSLIHLIMACHLRLLDIFDMITNHGRMCAHAVPLLPREHEPKFDMPEIKIGSFVAPKISAASMMIAMVIELQHSLGSRAEQLEVAVSLAVGNESKAAKIMSLQCESLKERASDTLEGLCSLRDNLMKLGVIR